MKGTTKFGLAVLVAALLLVGPAGRCSQFSAAGSPAHPCCPRTPAPIPEDCGKPDCAYVKAPALEIAGTGETQGYFLAFAAIAIVFNERLVAGIVPALPSAVPAARDLLLLIHQLVI
jgi:hypothetical protein